MAETMDIPATTIVVGTGYGDEGKGKVIGVLAPEHDVIGRGQGGANAGHTTTYQGIEVNTHQLPSGITMEGKLNVMGHGMFVDPVRLVAEMAELRGIGVEISPDNLAISSIAHVVVPKHKYNDAVREGGSGGQGSTKAGIAFVASDKVLRTGIRAHVFGNDIIDLFSKAFDGLLDAEIENSTEGCLTKEEIDDLAKQAREFAEAAKELEPYVLNTKLLVRERLAAGESVLLEGAQAFGLDINHGKYPYVTSSDTTTLGVAGGVGLNHKQIGRVIGVAKAIPTKVGGGPFVTQIHNKKIAALYRGKAEDIDGEFGKTTQRPRDIGYLDLVMLREAVEVNGIDEIALTKADVFAKESRTKLAIAYELDGEEITTLPDTVEELERCVPVYRKMPTGGDISGIQKFKNLNKPVRDIIKLIEDYVGKPVTIIGTGPAGEDTIIR